MASSGSRWVPFVQVLYLSLSACSQLLLIVCFSHVSTKEITIILILEFGLASKLDGGSRYSGSSCGVLSIGVGVLIAVCSCGIIVGGLILRCVAGYAARMASALACCNVVLRLW